MSNSMKVKIRTEDTHINLRLPSSLLYSKIVFKMIERAIYDKSGVHMEKEVSQKLHRLLKQAVKKYKGLKLVDIHSKDDEIIEITL